MSAALFDISKVYYLVVSLKYELTPDANQLWETVTIRYHDSTNTLQTINVFGLTMPIFTTNNKILTRVFIIDFPKNFKDKDVVDIYDVSLSLSTKANIYVYNISLYDSLPKNYATIDNRNALSSYYYEANNIEAKQYLIVGGKRISASNETTTWSGNIGDIIYNTNPVSGGFIGWVCTDIASNNARIWKTFGQIS